MDIYDQLAYSTIKINCDNISSGTGFFFRFEFENEKNAPVIVTNRHVVENARNIEFVFSLNNYFDAKERKVNLYKLTINDIQPAVIYHENPNVDLCIIPLNVILSHLKGDNIEPYIIFISDKFIPSQEELDELKFVEDILMIGYPNGISDTVNNLPIFRRGITATHPGIPFNGNNEFIVDMTIIPGSSGSPVMIVNDNGYHDKKGNFYFGKKRLFLLGINKAVFTANAEGRIVEVPAPTELKVYSQIGINLGIIIMSSELKYFADEILRRDNNKSND